MSSHEALVEALVDQRVLVSQEVRRQPQNRGTQPQIPQVIDAFSAVDRGDFVPHGHRSRAYANAPLRVGNFHLSAPFIYGVALEALALRRGHRFLHVGSGTGYLSTIAGVGVTSFERFRPGTRRRAS